jgi:hypothetical protein
VFSCQARIRGRNAKIVCMMVVGILGIIDRDWKVSVMSQDHPVTTDTADSYRHSHSYRLHSPLAAQLACVHIIYIVKFSVDSLLLLEQRLANSQLPP